jgi:hypothetical protein
VKSTISIPGDEDEELQEVLEADYFSSPLAQKVVVDGKMSPGYASSSTSYNCI